MKKDKVVIIGSTGSIGTQTIDVIETVGDKEIVAEDGGRGLESVPALARAVVGIVVGPGVAILHPVPGIDGDGPLLRVILGAQGDEVDDTALAGLDQGVVDDEGRGVEGVPLAPVGEVIPAAELVLHLVADQVDGVVVADLRAPGVLLHEPRPHIEHGPSVRVQGGGPEQGYAHRNGLPGLAAGEQVEEVDVAVRRGVDDLDKVLHGLVYVADAQSGEHIRLPLDQQGLARPGGAGIVAQLADDGLPGDLQGF